MGKYPVHLVGELNYQDVIRRASPGDSVRLVPEPQNPYDPRAIRASDVTGATLGYIERESWLTRAMLDDGTVVLASVMEIIGGEADKPSLGVVLEVLTAKDAEGKTTGAATTREFALMSNATAKPQPEVGSLGEALDLMRDISSWLQKRGRHLLGAAGILALYLAILQLTKPESGSQDISDAATSAAEAAATAAAEAATATSPILDDEAVKQCGSYLSLATRNGLIRSRPSPNRINVDERLWAELPASAKDTTMQAVSCELWRSSMPPTVGDYVVAYGWRTGKRLQMLTSVGMARD